MTGTDHASLLRRKLGAQPEPEKVKGAARPELDAMRAAARAAHTAAGLKVEMRGASSEVLGGLSEVIEAIQNSMLIVPFAAPDDVEGYVALSHEFAQSLIEKATTGSLSKLPLEPRRASSIDMLLCRDFLGRFLETWREISEGKTTLQWLSGYAAQAAPVDVDLMVLNSRDVPYKLFRIEVRLDTQRDAQLLTAFPVDRFPKQEIQAAPPTNAEVDWGKLWQEAVMDTNAELDAVLVKFPLPLADIKQWSPGQLVSIPRNSLSTVSLGRRNGAVVASARLGQAQGFRALRLNALTKDAANPSLPPDGAGSDASAAPDLEEDFQAQPPVQTGKEEDVPAQNAAFDPPDTEDPPSGSSEEAEPTNEKV